MLTIQKDGPHPLLGTLIPWNNAVGIIQRRKCYPPVFPRLYYLLQARRQGQYCNQSEKEGLDRSCKCSQVGTSDQCRIISYDPHMVFSLLFTVVVGFLSLLSWLQLFSESFFLTLGAQPMLLYQVLDALPVGSLACPTIAGAESPVSERCRQTNSAQLWRALDISIPLLRGSKQAAFVQQCHTVLTCCGFCLSFPTFQSFLLSQHPTKQRQY